VPSEQVQRDAAAYKFVAALGAAMAAANYRVTMVGETMAATSLAYGLENQMLALPNYVQVGSPTCDGLYIANPDFDLRYDQSFPLAKLVARAPIGAVDPAEGMAELERIRNQSRRFPVWVTVLGYAAQSTGLALILQPTPWSLVGAARHVVSGASRLVAGFMQITQLAFGILIAAQVAGIADTNLVTIEINRLGAWAPLLGVLVYGVGAMLYFGPPTSFLPWMLLMLSTAYAGQWVGNAVLGSYASGFGGGLTLILCALAISHRPNTPPTMSIAVGVQTGLLLSRAAIQLTPSPNRRAMHD
jgi:hypothetical protein